MVSGIPLIIRKNIELKGTRVGDYIYNAEEDSIGFELPYIFPCKFKVVGLRKVYATPMMVKLPTFLKYHNIDWLLQQLWQIRLIKENKLLIHGSAWSENGKGFLAVGFPNSGKTTAVLRALHFHLGNKKFCADENIILDSSGYMLPVNRATSLNPWIAKEIGYPLTCKQKIGFAIAKAKSFICPIFEPNIWVKLPYDRYKIKLDVITYLTPGKLKNKLRLLTDNEFPWYTNPVIQTYAYYTGLNLFNLYEHYSELISNAVNNCS